MAAGTTGTYVPTADVERIDALDVARGFALLGILIMNSTGMALYDSAYFNPSVDGGNTGADFGSWLFMVVYAEASMRTLFSLLFGAGIILFLERLEARPTGLQPVDVHARRMLWLLAFGLVNTFVILYPFDILQQYAIAGMFLFPFRKLSARGLVKVFVLLFAISLTWNTFGYFDTQKTVAEYHALVAERDAGAELNEEQTEKIEGWEKRLEGWYPDEEKRKEKLELRTDPSLPGLWVKLAGDYVKFYNDTDFWLYLLDAVMAIVLGMALFRAGIMSGQASRKTYWLMLIFGYGIGLGLGAWRAAVLIASNYDFLSLEPHWILYDTRRIAIGLGHLALIHLVCAYDVLSALRRMLAAIGRMALTNYLTQSVLQVIAFYGVGFALHQQLQRHEVGYIILAIWLFQAVFSSYWMKHYRFGPMEWLWRALTYWQRPPIRRRPSAQDGPVTE